jgi:AraC family transcriptional regulator
MMESRLHNDKAGVVVRSYSDGSTLSPSWRFAYYAPGVRLPMHSHDVAQFSILLAGSARETTPRGAFDCEPTLMETKPAGFAHSNEFGPEGALLLSINLPQSDTLDSEGFGIDSWRVQPAERVRGEWKELAGAMASGAARAVDLEAITIDLMAGLTNDEPDLARKEAPAWLLRARAAVRETDLDFQSIANDAGVHRVHLARSFRRHFNVSMTEYRRRARLSDAVRQLVHDGACASTASHAAGFADQSHLTRTLRRALGVTPARLRSLFAA